MYSRIATVLIVSAFATSAFAMSNRPEPEGSSRVLAAGGAFTTLTATENPGCPRVIITGTFVVTGTVDEGGGAETVAVNVWDDGTFITSVTAVVPVGATQSYSFSIAYSGTVLNGAPGVGVYLEDAVGLAATQTFDQNGSLAPTATTSCPPVGNSIVTFGDAAQAVPALSPLAAALLAAAIGALGMILQRRAS